MKGEKQKTVEIVAFPIILVTVVDSNFLFPIHTASTQIRPDVTIFPNTLRKVIYS